MSDSEQDPLGALLDGIMEKADQETPDDAYHCPNCRGYTVTEVLQTVQRPEFDAENEVWGCSNCEYSFIPQTEWREIGPYDTDTDRSGGGA